MPFAIDVKTTYKVDVSREKKRDHRVWVANPGPGLEKRQCTLPICISPESKVRIAIIFRRSGKRISNDEKKAYHPKWMFTGKKMLGWTDTKFSVNWVNNTLKAGTANEEGNEFLLFCDNLSSQTSEEFLVAVRVIDGVVWFGVSGATDIWQLWNWVNAQANGVKDSRRVART